MKKIVTLLLLAGLAGAAFGQGLMQTIRGTVVDKQSQTTLPGVNIVLLNMDSPVGTTTDDKGEFRLENVPVGRQGIKLTFIGYAPVEINNLLVGTGKELVLNIQMDELVIETGEVVIKAFRKDQPINKMASVSARSFTIEETEKYAGSWGDPSRMAMNFAGVMGGGDQINDIVIRGNSPNGLLWRLEGINIPNPNHFGALGTTGGPVSMLNNNLLANSDFYTGAFPAGYGNALSGAFDLQMRNGNNEKREYLGQVGFNGFELGVEGPFSKNYKGSYLINYRYSTLGVLGLIGLDMGIGAVPYYQDLSFRINLPTEKFGRFTIFGLGGLSHINFIDESTDTIKNWQTGDILSIDTLLGKTDFTSDMGVAGLSHVYYFNPSEVNSARLKTTLAISGTRTTTMDSMNVDGELSRRYGNKRTGATYSIATELSKKFNSHNNMVAGLIYDHSQINFVDSAYVEYLDIYVNQYKLDANFGLLQGYATWQHKFSDLLTLNTGVHSQLATINDHYTIEPRVGLKWDFAEKQSLSVGYGMHSQLQPNMIYFMETITDTINNISVQTNKDLDFSKSHQAVFGYNYLIRPNFRLKLETYYQHLYNIPIERKSSHVSMLNYGTSYFIELYDSLENGGTGTNYGIDITIEKFLAKNYYMLATISLFNSTYKGSDGVERNTTFNGRYVINTLGGYEFKFRKGNSLSVDLKATFAGGLCTTPINIDESRDQGTTVYDYSRAYETKHTDYYRIDVRISYKKNKPKYSIEYAMDMQNLTNHKNRFIEAYDPNTGNIEQVTQMGIMPMAMMRVQF